ncbi:uncharacterized protein LY89DRAFT_62297 [Mollisia scopiformis]|uniref:Uncharacterized protein n=1 Tax=Mollisia scopiformis TaxID=149040 RepID=A0A194XCE3_MOLSC|nr:uncharacterized protein LY89DRAFT_62297 [Mollisia scopiformis]KUJ17826.1 hypothetical protein LY89DRAFT_62297 [Mollisia scopiformis]
MCETVRSRAWYSSFQSSLCSNLHAGETIQRASMIPSTSTVRMSITIHVLVFTIMVFVPLGCIREYRLWFYHRSSRSGLLPKWTAGSRPPVACPTLNVPRTSSTFHMQSLHFSLFIEVLKSFRRACCSVQ